MSMIGWFNGAEERMEGHISCAYNDGAGRFHPSCGNLTKYKEEGRKGDDAVLISFIFLETDTACWGHAKEHGKKFLQEAIKGYGRVREYDFFKDVFGVGELTIAVELSRGHYYPFYEATEQAYKKMLKGNFGQPTLSNKLREKVIAPLRKAFCGF